MASEPFQRRRHWLHDSHRKSADIAAIGCAAIVVWLLCVLVGSGGCVARMVWAKKQSALETTGVVGVE